MREKGRCGGERGREASFVIINDDGETANKESSLGRCHYFASDKMFYFPNGWFSCNFLILIPHF